MNCTWTQYICNVPIMHLFCAFYIFSSNLYSTIFSFKKCIRLIDFGDDCLTGVSKYEDLQKVTSLLYENHSIFNIFILFSDWIFMHVILNVYFIYGCIKQLIEINSFILEILILNTGVGKMKANSLTSTSGINITILQLVMLLLLCLFTFWVTYK